MSHDLKNVILYFVKKSIYNEYVRKRMKERGVTEADIEYALKHRDITMPGRRRGRKRIFSWIGNRCLNLVIKEGRNFIRIITVAWRGE